MIQFCNVDFDIGSFSEVDLFVCTVSYEKRSFFLLDQVIQIIDKDALLFFATDNYAKFDVSREKIRALKELGYDAELVDYQEYAVVIARIQSAILSKQENKQSAKIIVDYSSMPRSWYSRLPNALEEILRPDDVVYFWYCEGNYKTGYSGYPTAGTDKAFEYFSGKASLLPKKRTHIFALSYDISRTQGIIEKCEPEYVIVCEAHDPTRSDIHKNIIDANQNIMDQAAMVVSLDISDFCFMVTKLREIANELIESSDVIFVPDGPKPLILAMSQIPSLLKQPGITCIHAKRDLSKFVPVDVTASGKIVGFSMQIVK